MFRCPFNCVFLHLLSALLHSHFMGLVTSFLQGAVALVFTVFVLGGAPASMGDFSLLLKYLTIESHDADKDNKIMIQK